MASDLATYTERLARISAILEPYLHVSQYVLATPDVNPTEAPNGLAVRWFDRQSGRPMVSVFIDQLPDIGEALAGLRAEVNGEEYYEPGSSSEVTGLGAGEFAFLQHYADSVTAIVGNCRISIHPPDEYQGLAPLVDAAVEIGREVGCTAYRNDFIPPPYPDEWPKANWGIGPGIPGFPPAAP
jgi:hypothetical protein